jgi:uncharacterized protein YjbI with pentapeptide repeats
MAKATRTLRTLLTRNDPRGFADALNEPGAREALAGETFSALSVSHYDFSGMDLSNTEWTDCVLDHILFNETILEGAYLSGSTLIDCTMGATTLSGVSMDGTVLRGCTIRACTMGGSELTGTGLDNCTLDDVDIEDASWTSVTFTGGTITNLRGSSGSLSTVTLRDVQTTDVVLDGMELLRCVASGESVPAGFEKLSGRRKRIV